jgi:hypothetical protein
LPPAESISYVEFDVKKPETVAAEINTLNQQVDSAKGEVASLG